MKISDNNERYIVEYIAIGNSVKATAFDPITMKEVSVIGSTNTPKKLIGQLAVRKLIYMSNKA